tara:strand:- start:53947 stop:55239 length:1293 start_codon:yes stop_codon:yes gene_type:complete
MEIRDPIHGSINLSDAEINIIDSVVFQRLRSIKQLGFSEFSFPGAVHNRYIHSIGVCHLAGLAFDSIFKSFQFSSQKVRERLRQAVRMGALLHDIGHGPLSHTTEEVMPQLQDLDIKIYGLKKSPPEPRIANHEDYTIKFLTDSALTPIIEDNPCDISATHIACLVDKSLQVQDDFFTDSGLNFRPILSQIVSSEMDVDRMDYLRRDSYFCGTNYGQVELEWLLSHMTYHQVENEVYLALNRRALYTFDDFLLSRHHMHLMVYFHHKSIIYEEMLLRYLTSEDCSFRLPADIEGYMKCTDYALYEHLDTVDNPWAQRIARREPFKMVYELHSIKENDRCARMRQDLEEQGFEVIHANSKARLSKYFSGSVEDKAYKIFVVDRLDWQSEPYPIENSTEIFEKYEEIRRIERLYVAPEKKEAAKNIIRSKSY